MKNIVNPEMLILARESRGLSQADLARDIEVTQGKVSKYENGMLQVSEADLERICSVLGYIRDFFFQDAKVYGLGSSFLFNRKRARAPVLIQRRVQAQINILRMQVERLLRSVEMEAANEFVRLDIDAFDGDVEKIAEMVRATWRLPLGPIANLTEAVESAGGIVLRCAFGTPTIDGAHLWLDGLPPLFFLNDALPGDRLRWTLAHEVGHAIMHRNPTGEIEDEANRFASEFLVPGREMNKHAAQMTLQRAAALKPVWKVSMAAIIKRAYDLGGINEARYRRLFTSLSAEGYRINEPFPIPVEEPMIMRKLVELHRTGLGYDDFDLASLLFAPDPQFFTPEVSPTLMRVSGKPFIAFFPKSGGQQDTGYRLVM